MRRIAIKLLIDYEYMSVVTGCVLDCLSHTWNVRRGDRRSSIAPGAADITGDVPNLLDVGGALAATHGAVIHAQGRRTYCQTPVEARAGFLGPPTLVVLLSVWA